MLGRRAWGGKHRRHRRRDAFAAALAVALVEGESLIDARAFASAATALATTKLAAHAGLPSRDAVRDLLAHSLADIG
jgi:sugar/nucleoside kinase (ribokinase family)